ncbi:MAG: hypothetical protein AB9888_08455 [Bacteroidales bacterium]
MRKAIMLQTLTLNARFLTQPLTGVQRYSLELLNALDLLVQPGQARALVPSGERMATAWKNIPLLQAGRLGGNLWEQLDLPRLCGGHWLFSPSNIGPYGYTPQVVTIHDANVFVFPQAYSRLFRWKYQLTFRRFAHSAAHIFTDSSFLSANW